MARIIVGPEDVRPRGAFGQTRGLGDQVISDLPTLGEGCDGVVSGAGSIGDGGSRFSEKQDEDEKQDGDVREFLHGAEPLCILGYPMIP